MTIHLVHGFRVSDRGTGTVGCIEPHLDTRALPYRRLSYPWTHLITLNRNSRWAVEELCDRVQPGDGAIAHSNGCWIVVQAAELGAPLDWLILVNPALHPRHELPGQLRQVFVYYSEGDVAVRAGRYWRILTRAFPWRWNNRHPWGAMGALGYTGEDPRVVNTRMPRSFGHSGVWKDEQSLMRIAERAAVQAHAAASARTAGSIIEEHNRRAE